MGENWGRTGRTRAPVRTHPHDAPSVQDARVRPVEVLGEVDVLMPRDPLVLERAPVVPVLRVGQRAHDRAELEAGAPRRAPRVWSECRTSNLLS
jgi:hypothetical protein